MELQSRALIQEVVANKIFTPWTSEKSLSSFYQISHINDDKSRFIATTGIVFSGRDSSRHINVGQFPAFKVTRGQLKLLRIRKILDVVRGASLDGNFPLYCCVPAAKDASAGGMLEEDQNAHASSCTGFRFTRASETNFLQSRRVNDKCLPLPDPEHLILCGDASSISNRLVTRCFVRALHPGDPFLSSWWGQVNKAEHHGMGGLLCNGPAKPEIAPSSASEFSNICFPGVRETLLTGGSNSNGFCQSSETEEPAEIFVDDDYISVVRLRSNFQGLRNGGIVQSRFKISIPKQIMTFMPPPPNDWATPGYVHEFNIEVQMADMKAPCQVDACIDWLLQEHPTTVALVCKHGYDRCLSLIQLSAHQRCVLIRVPCKKAVVPVVPVRLRTLLCARDITKVGAEIQKDSLAIFYFLGVATNSCVRVSQYVLGQKQRKPLLSLFRELYQWDWIENKQISCSDWGSKEISLAQMKYAVLNAWASRLVWAGQTEMWKIETPPFSLADLPLALLDYFGRSVFCFESRNRKDGETAVEVKGAHVELHQGHLSLKQKNFRSRVMGQKSKVELRFKDGRKPQKYVTLYREGSRVVLDNAEPSFSVKTVQELEEDISMISNVFVDNSDNLDVQKQKLEDSLYMLLCIPEACPRHILVALGFLGNETMIIPSRQFSLEGMAVKKCKAGLNPSQSEAWKHMLSNPLSAVIGPPGTGKTTVISAVAKAWVQLAGAGETLLCAAHQNVAVRHMAETMIKAKISGVLLLISEDYFVGWHEKEYARDVKEASVISGSLMSSGMDSWTSRNGNHPPRILLCTLALIGSDSFHTCLMGNKVSSMIIDECSQASEGSLIPTLGGLPHLQMLSVVGDPCQLPPFGMRPTHSVFDLLSKRCDVKLLQQQYRMPYFVSQFVSAEFYGGKLYTDVRKRWEDSDRPLLWVGVRGTVDTLSGGTSLCNQEEAEVVVEWCRIWKDGGGVKGEVVVLTLYEAQRSLISTLLSEKGMGEEVLVYNADSFQGQEAEVVLISLVVGDKVSAFAADRRRACVLLSRARRELRVFGNIAAIKTGHCFPWSSSFDHHNIWKSLAEYCEYHGWVVASHDVQALANSSI